MSDNLKWLNEIDFQNTLRGDALEIAECCGVDVLIKLIENGFTKVTINIPGNVLNDAKKDYVKKNYDGSNAKKLARVLDVSEGTVYKWGKE